MPRVTELKINTVRSSFGHRFMSTGDREEWNGNLIGYYEECMVCGALYVLRATPDDVSDGAYVNSAGHEPTECSGDPSAQHGDRRAVQDCNCLCCSDC